jgi:hypothetical protein
MKWLSAVAAWCAFLSGFSTVACIVTLILFFIRDEPWGLLTDAISVINALSSMPVLLVVYRRHRAFAPTIGRLALAIGLFGLAGAAVDQILLLSSVGDVRPTAPIAFGLFGVALVVFGFLARAEGSRPAGLSIVGTIAGVGYVLINLGFLLGGERHPLSGIGGGISVLAYPVWAIWLGRILRSEQLAVG